MNRLLSFTIVVLFMFSSLYGVNITEEEEGFYASITNSADYKYTPVWDENKYTENELIEDIKVSLVESVPFGFFLAFAGIFLTEASQQGTFQPVMKDFKEYEGIYIYSIAGFALTTTLINVFTYYNYNGNKKENEKEQKDGKKSD